MKNKYDYNIIISVDIGLSGGIAFFDSVSSELLSIRDMPTKKTTNAKGKEKNILDVDALLFLLEVPKLHKDSALVVYEDVHAFPGQGVVAVGTLLEQKGILRGILRTLGYDELPISPKQWQKHLGIVPPKEIKAKDKRKKWLKNESLETARAKFPDWVNKLEKPTAHGLSDAMLIGQWFIETSPEK